MCVGVSIRKNLVAILSLGPKKSDEDYTKEDIEVLSILADALGVAITNASAYEDLRHKANLVTIGTLAAGIKHDIAKPIGGVKPLATAFLVRLKKGNIDDPAKMLNESGDIIEQCCDTFQKVLDISDTYVARPKEKENPVLLSVSQQVDAAISLLQYKINKSGISVIKMIPETLPNVIFDKDYMGQILDNIIANAIDAVTAAKRTKEESQIIVSAREVENRTLNVRLEIRDTGTGIPDKIKEKIFKAWFSTKGKDGTGLGLFLVSDLILRGGGTIDVETEEGKGSTFILSFKGVK
jgi:signal transduction histidine kinase